MYTPSALIWSGRTCTLIDPAPPTSGLLEGIQVSEDLPRGGVESLGVPLPDLDFPLFERYHAIFSLGNICMEKP